MNYKLMFLIVGCSRRREVDYVTKEKKMELRGV